MGAIRTGRTSAQVQHRATCRQQTYEARHKTWLGRSTVRSLRAGEHFALTQSTLDALSELQGEADREFCVHSVHGLGVNNLPKELGERLMRKPAADPFAELDDTPASELLDTLAHDPMLSEQAAELGYANRFEALRRLIPWRPLAPTAPTALGAQTAIVVGPDGSTSPQGADELYTDALGRIRVQFHWQAAPGADVLAAHLAREAVGQVGEAMRDAWKGLPGESPDVVAKRFLVHPNDTAWMDQVVAAWARTHPNEIKRGESSTEWEHLRKEHEKEVRETLEQVRRSISKAQPQRGETRTQAAGRVGANAAERTWTYIKNNYEVINKGDPQRVKP